MDWSIKICNWATDPHDNESLISPNIPVQFFGGKLLGFGCGAYVKNDQNEVAVTQAAIESFLSLGDSVREAASKRIVDNYRSVLEDWKGTEYPVKELPLHNSLDIWNYVDPRAAYVFRDNLDDDSIYIMIECECEWEPEHGLQLVFKNGSCLTRVSQFDGHLTD